MIAPAESSFIPSPDPYSESNQQGDMQYASTMDGTTAPGPIPVEPTAIIESPAQALVDLMKELTSDQRRQVMFAAQRVYCFGCGDELPKTGGVCRNCNGE